MIKVVIALLGVLVTMPAQGMVPEAYEVEGYANKVYCVYERDVVCLELLDNSEGKYSTAWQNVAMVIPGTSIGLGLFYDDVSIPERVTFKDKEYVVVGLDTLGCQAYLNRGLSSLSLPYEIKFIDERAITGDAKWKNYFEDLELPPAVRYIGKYGVSNLEHLKSLTSLSPLPATCMSSTGRLLRMGDTMEEGEEGPFAGSDTNATMYVPAGFKFFYEQHPAYQGFENIWDWVTVPWAMKHVAIPNGTLIMAYIGNGEMLVHGTYIDDDSLDHLEIPETVEAYGTTCRVVGIGRNACNRLRFKSLSLPEGIRYIASHAFVNSSIEEVILPESCLYAAYGAFRDMPGLRKVVLKTTGKPIFAADAFMDMGPDVTLYTDADIDRTEAPWSDFAHIESLASGVRTVWEDEAAGRIYNLQGIPVEKMISGQTYIRAGKKFVAR